MFCTSTIGIGFVYFFQNYQQVRCAFMVSDILFLVVLESFVLFLTILTTRFFRLLLTRKFLKILRISYVFVVTWLFSSAIGCYIFYLWENEVDLLKSFVFRLHVCSLCIQLLDFHCFSLLLASYGILSFVS